MDKKGGLKETPSIPAKFTEQMMEQFNLIDVWRFLNPDSRRFTRREMCRGGLVQSRLDYWLISNHMLYDYQHQDIYPGLRSDHSLVSISFRIHCTEQRGRGFFKFDYALLKDSKYVQ